MAVANTFKEAFPERGITPPTLPGETPFQGTVLINLRRSQLHNIARAWGINVDPNLTKDQILHPLIDAERRGVFNNPPESPYHWEMAQRDPDMPVEPLKNKMPEPRKERSKGGDVPIHFKTLQSTCKSLHINCVGMTKQEMHDAILKVLNEGQGEVRPEGEGESLEGENREVGRPFGALVEKGSVQIEGED